MKSTTVEQFEVLSVSDLASLDETILNGAVSAYQQAFAAEPYTENFSADEAKDALSYMLEQKGDLLIGVLGTKAVSLAGGFVKPDNTYYIEELAVLPSEQNKGYGRLTLDALLKKVANDRRIDKFELRTTARNEKSLNLYEDFGFVRELGSEVTASRRQDGRIALDERIYLSKPPTSETERLNILKRTVIAYPSGNTTAIVFDQLLNTNREKLNTQVMDAWKALRPEESEIEQCCFVTLPVEPDAIGRVEMFGGEFCGNATRSAIWALTGGKDYVGLIEVSNVDSPLAFRVRNNEVTVDMPLPKAGELVRRVPEGILVQLDGIAQLIVTEPADEMSPRQLLTNLLATNKYKLCDKPAVGKSYYDRTSGKAQFCVWVKAIDTIFDETACGSGTCAIGVAEALKTYGTTMLDVVQPSGETIRTEAINQAGTPPRSSITGSVAILYDGELQLS